MKLGADFPNRIQLPWAAQADPAYIRPIPIPSQVSVETGAASFVDGFPAATMIPLAAGGKWPYGQDMNGILNQLSAWGRWQAAGAPIVWDSSFATGGYTGGYPAGAVVQANPIGAYYLSLADDNTSNPFTTGTYWSYFTPLNLYGYDGGTADAGSTTLSFAANDYNQLSGYAIRIKKMGQNNTGPYTLNINGLGTRQVIHVDGTPLAAGDLPAYGYFTVIWDKDGNVYHLQSSALGAGALQSQTGNWANDSGTGGVNALVINLVPPVTSVSTLYGVPIRIKKANNGPNTGDMVINVNGTGNVSLQHSDLSQILPGELSALGWSTVVYDGARFQLQSHEGGRTLGPPLIYCAGASATASPALVDCGKTFLFSGIGNAGGAHLTLPDANVVGNGWWCHLRCNSSLGDYGVVNLTGGQLLDGKASRIFGNNTDVTIMCDGAGGFFTASGKYVHYSGQLSIPVHGVVSFTHNLSPLQGAASMTVGLGWVCVAAEQGYSVGDVVTGQLSVVNEASSTNTIGLMHDASGNTVRVITNNAIVLPNKSTANATVMTLSSWRLQIRVETD